MVSECSYRPTHTQSEAVAELYRCAGTSFDPELVDRFVEMLKDLSSSQAVLCGQCSKDNGDADWTTDRTTRECDRYQTRTRCRSWPHDCEKSRINITSKRSLKWRAESSMPPRKRTCNGCNCCATPIRYLNSADRRKMHSCIMMSPTRLSDQAVANRGELILTAQPGPSRSCDATH